MALHSEALHSSAPVSDGEMDMAVKVFLAERTRLLRVAYRVVGDFAAAEDVVQEAWMRWQRVDRRQINNPAAFLTTATTHLAINLVQSARHRHELPTEAPRASLDLSQDPTDHADRTETVERTMGFLMAKLSPGELAAFVLRKCFDFPYDEIAELLGTSPANVRQLVRRGHVSLASSRVRRVNRDAHRRLVEAFIDANETGNLAGLVDLLVEAAHAAPRCSKSRGRHGRATTGSARVASQAA
ncbi:sigma-70 family RNA polymerase sigma factor [Nocardioides halotolerans]|uniref:sigma-70 family RNA polymerase sigma factor n=1 Tax=Nocardioides halotolerans TaxID=433660 RepID=UPI00146CE3D9|nr:sigma-70 family RNA polymerase sigma factor [Nocardioides halotolerans]